MSAIVGYSGSPTPEILETMSGAIAHRGTVAETIRIETGSLALSSPDAGGNFTDTATHTPSRTTLALCGWAYQNQHRATAPTLLNEYKRKGMQFLDGLHGAFIIAILQPDTLHLIRDHIGERTLHYGVQAERLFFASESKALLALSDFPRRLDPGGLARYLTFSFSPGSATLLKDVFELPPGHCLTWQRGKSSLPRLQRYYRIEEYADSNERLSDREHIDRFRATLDRAIQDRIAISGGLEHCGILLSGGLDSSAVTAALRKITTAPLSTFTLHFGKKYANELEYARLAAQQYETRHEEVRVRPRAFLPELQRMIWHLDDPIGDPVTIGNFALTGHVNGRFSSLFNGEGGDPCFGGPKNLPMMLQHWYGGIERTEQFRARKYLESFRRCYNDLENLIAPDLLREISPREDLEKIVSPFLNGNSSLSFLKKLLAANIRLKGAHLILPKVERLYAARGLTPLSPLFDRRVAELAFQLPEHLLLARGVEKIVIKQAFDDLPAEILQRPKSGMRVPVHFWFQGELRRYVRKVLAPGKLKQSGLFNEKYVSRIQRYDLEEGPGRFGIRLWMLLTFEIWRQQTLD